MTYSSHPIGDLPVGTLLEIVHGQGVTEIAVVICAKPLQLRKANPFERFQFMFKQRRTKAFEIGAAIEAVDAIEKAKGAIKK